MDSNRYEFIIKNDTAPTRKAVAESGSGGGKKEKTAFQVGLGASIAAFDKAKPYINMALSEGINRVQIGTGQNEYAEKLRFTQQIANDGINMLEAAIYTGIITGNPLGALIGVGATLISKGASIAVNQQRINESRQVEGISLEFARQRAGYNGSRGRYQ